MLLNILICIDYFGGVALLGFFSSSIVSSSNIIKKLVRKKFIFLLNHINITSTTWCRFKNVFCTCSFYDICANWIGGPFCNLHCPQWRLSSFYIFHYIDKVLFL